MTIEHLHNNNLDKSDNQETEEIVNTLLQKLPKPLQETWEDKISNMQPLDAVIKLEDFLQKRSEALNKTDRPSHVESKDNCPKAIANYLSRLESDKIHHIELGRGKSGKVISSINTPDTCYKILFNKDRQDVIHGENDVAREADLQDEIAKLQTNDVIVPKVQCVIRYANLRAIMMQQLDAVSIKDVLGDKAILPKTFNIDSFFRKLETFVTKMHDNHYYHRDLHAGNIMVDKKTGNPCIIDFGLSKKTFFEEDATILNLPNGERVAFPDDFSSISLVKTRIGGFVNKRKRSSYAKDHTRI